MAMPTHDWQLTTAETVARALAVLTEHRLGLNGGGVPGQLSLTGGSSLEGLLTKGDIDLHLRVMPGEFAIATSRLTLIFDRARQEIWTPSFAVFERDSTPPVGIAVTVVDSEHDRRFVRSWERMRTDETARRYYNLLKRRGGDVEAAKAQFFTDLVA
ncbi:hypothetical protein [Arthrobacter sp. SX1312]|uniref:hypothetical protein n=1 Tax=Arthrobacter sp. SX1312 TaxID=2058896 RepID=UPI0011B02540|nr:hypothetical protein [Arthrobacter sp. SX1312]